MICGGFVVNCNVLVIDDDELLVYSIKRILNEDPDLSVDVAYSGDEGMLKYSDKKHQIVITDLIMQGMDGLEVIKKIRDLNSETLIIMISGKGSEEISNEAIQLGAYDYISKPFNNNEFYKIIRNAKTQIELRQSNKELKQSMMRRRKFHHLYYASDEMSSIIEMIQKIAIVNVPVLILGESGTGKELVADAIHKESERRDEPFIRINCGAIPEHLLESEFFGYEKGAFTGATQAKPGKLEMAQGGTVFLDEIGDLPLDLQVKLLRFLEDGSIDRVGSIHPRKVDVRVIAATNINLDNAVLNRKFRLDLYYRLEAFKIELPSLRNRKDDIIYISEKFIEEYTESFDMEIKKIPQSVKKAFLKYSWPGNIRELKNVIQNMIIFSSNEVLELASLPSQFMDDEGGRQEVLSQNNTLDQYFQEKVSLKQFNRDMEKSYISFVLKKIANKTKVAEYLDISRKSLYEKIKEYGLSK